MIEEMVVEELLDSKEFKQLLTEFIAGDCGNHQFLSQLDTLACDAADELTFKIKENGYNFERGD